MAAEEEIVEPDTLIEVIVEDRITVWDSAPAMLGTVTPFLPLHDLRGSTLRLVLLSGDWVPMAMPGALHEAWPTADVVVLGGATECTVWSNHFLVTDIDPTWASIPYGVPIDNCRYYVLDADGRQCSVDQPGELYIAGECVAVGYAGDPTLSGAKFSADPFDPRPGERMYRTGDRARWRAGGWLEFLGRLDDQVKVRGYRVELGEVQSALATAPGVCAASVVAVSGPAGNRLAGFWVPDGTGPGDVRVVRDYLRSRIPAYMVPELLSPIAALPLTAAGKVDLRSLEALALEGNRA